MSTPRPKRPWGPAVVDGEVKYVSPSSLSKADTSQYGGCLRAYYYRYVLRIPDIAPKPAAELGSKCHAQIEQYLKTGRADFSPIVKAGDQFIPAPNPHLLVEFNDFGGIQIAGIPVVTKMDLINRSEHYIDAVGTLQTLPKQVVEVVDWKTTGRISRAKSGSQLKNILQMIAYGHRAAIMYPDVTHVRLSHVYFQTKGRPSALKRTILVEAQELSDSWHKFEPLAKTIIDIAKVSDVNSVPGNRKACSAWGGCTYKDRCNIKNETTLLDIFKEDSMPGILDQITDEDINKRVVELDVAQKQRKNATPPPGFRAAVQSIQLANKGLPNFKGEAAKHFSYVTGGTNSRDIDGHGFLGKLTIEDPAQLIGLAAEVADMAQAEPPPVPTPPAILPPDAPESDPVLAADPLPVVEDKLETSSDKPKPKPKPPKRPSFNAMKKNKLVEECERLSTIIETFDTTAETVINSVELYVDCIPQHCTASSLDYYIDYVYKTLSPDTDVRLTEEGAFGKWKGLVGAIVSANPPHPGVYYASARNRDLVQVVVDALQPNCVVYVRGL